MTLQQLEYIVAIDTHRHFVTAAAHCYVTQATLSMMVKKLEDELGIRIFDRSRHPVTPTPLGVEVVAHARRVLQEARRIPDLVHEAVGEVSGQLRLGVIPTLAPYLVPRFLPALLAKFPNLQVKISEATTEELIARLESNGLDAGLLATPLERPQLVEHPLFHERFFVYASAGEKQLKKDALTPADIDPDSLWLLEEGHCLRAQVLQLCHLPRQGARRLEFETGSIEMLLRLVDANGGSTILPELALSGLTAKQKQQVRAFKNPAPVRAISVVTQQHFARRKVVDALTAIIRQHLPAEMHERFRKKVLPPQAAV
ncbi:MAG: hydrogen peroxide-inducible genes activator [Chitinophagaceae bacterium]|nr:MAG: hydrogen peroxide-inducible genes activator [Chitinophagaceae bacterium]